MPLKALIVAVSAVATAALGFWMAGLAGLAIGAAAGAGLGFMAIRLISPHEEPAAAPVEEDLPEFTWMTGTNSSTLGMTLGVDNQGTIRDLCPGPALIPPQMLLARGIAPLTGETGLCGYLAGVKDPEIAIGYAEREPTPFDLEKTIAKAHLLPGENADEAPIHIDRYLESLKLTVTRALQMGMANPEELQLHLQNNLLPVFESGESFRAHLRPRIGVYFSAEEFTQRFSDNLCLALRPKANAIVALFDRVRPIPFTEQERDLIENPCPLVFASANLRARLADPNGIFGLPGELAVYQPALLGPDLQYVFTTARNIDRIARAVAPFGVKVRDLDSIR